MSVGCNKLWILYRSILSEQIIEAEDVQIFDGRLDKFMNNQEIIYDFKASFKFITKAGTATINYVNLESEAS